MVVLPPEWLHRPSCGCHEWKSSKCPAAARRQRRSLFTRRGNASNFDEQEVKPRMHHPSSLNMFPFCRITASRLILRRAIAFGRFYVGRLWMETVDESPDSPPPCGSLQLGPHVVTEREEQQHLKVLKLKHVNGAGLLIVAEIKLWNAEQTWTECKNDRKSIGHLYVNL